MRSVWMLASVVGVVACLDGHALAQDADGLSPPPAPAGATRLPPPPGWPLVVHESTPPSVATEPAPDQASASDVFASDVSAGDVPPPPPTTTTGIEMPRGYAHYDGPVNVSADGTLYPLARPVAPTAPSVAGEGGGFSFARMLAEVGAGVAGVFVGGYGGYQLGCAVAGSIDCAPVGVLVAVVGGILLTSTAVAVTGDLLGGRGNWAWATLGSAVGAGVGFVFALGAAEALGDATPFVAGLFPVAGSVFVYELVSSNRGPALSDAPTLIPSASLHEGGGTISVVGAF